MGRNLISFKRTKFLWWSQTFPIMWGEVNMGWVDVKVLFTGGGGSCGIFESIRSLRTCRTRFSDSTLIKLQARKIPTTKLSTAPLFRRLFCCLPGKTTTKTPPPSHTNNTLIKVLHFLVSELNSKSYHQKSNNQGIKVYG